MQLSGTPSCFCDSFLGTGCCWFLLVYVLLTMFRVSRMSRLRYCTVTCLKLTSLIRRLHLHVRPVGLLNSISSRLPRVYHRQLFNRRPCSLQCQHIVQVDKEDTHLFPTETIITSTDVVCICAECEVPLLCNMRSDRSGSGTEVDRSVPRGSN